MLEKNLEKLEFNKVLDILSSFAKTNIGKEYCLSLRPMTDKVKLEKLLSETNTAILLRYKKGQPPIGGISTDIQIWLKALNSNKVLSISSILELAKLLKISREMKSYFFDDKLIDLDDFSVLYDYFNNLYTNIDLENKIFNIILDEDNIADNASSELLNIRTSKRNLEQEIRDKLNHYISSYSKYLQEPVITIRNDRFVIPVKEEYKSNVKGFVHDMSNSGSTIFIEPLSIFELNSKITNLIVEENIEIEKILTNLTNLLADISSQLENNLNIIGILDFIFAKANYSISIDGNMPIINTDKKINFIKARHPLIPKEKVVSIDINLGYDFDTLVITGPNTGGKTVTLKTVGLLTLMAMSGLNIPANENSSFYIFDNVFADIGDEQSIQESLSTFSSHMLNIVEIMNNSTENSLVLVDELGSGTDPIEGSSLAISILEELHNRNTLTIATTHYPEIKNYALTTSGFKNASQEFDIATLSPTYKLLIGVPGKSNAFAISEKLGLSKKILDRANSFIDADTIRVEDLLKSIYDDKQTIENEKVEIENKLKEISILQKNLEKDNFDLEEKQKEIIEKAKIEAREILYGAKEEASQIIKEMRSVSKDSSSLKVLDNYRNKLNTSLKETVSSNSNVSNINSNINISELEIGMNVFVHKFMTDGTLLSLPNKDDQVQVQIGSMKTFVPVSNLSKSKKQTNNINNKKSGTSKISKSKTISSEINVIGQNVEEAIFVIDKYLDDCSLAKLKTIRIVHGKGTGKLREGIHKFLRTNPHVSSFRIGTYGEGEMGVTVVELK